MTLRIPLVFLVIGAVGSTALGQEAPAPLGRRGPPREAPKELTPPSPPSDEGNRAKRDEPDVLDPTVEIGVGAGVTTHRAGAEPAGAAVLAPSLGIGFWIDGRTTMTVRLAGHWFRAGADDQRAMTAFLGPTLQHYYRNRVFLGGGFGLAVLDERGAMAETEIASGFDLRAGYDLLQSGMGALSVSGEATITLRERGPDAAIALQLGYQYR